MELILKPKFRTELENIVYFISKDSKNRAKIFSKKLYEGLHSIKVFPYRFRKSYYYDDERIRDYIFKGYTIPYLVDEENREIVVLDIFKWNRTGENHDI